MTTRYPVMALLAAAVLVAVFALLRADDDVLVDPNAPAAVAAIAAARDVVPGEVVDVRRDSDDAHKWEVTLRRETGASTRSSSSPTRWRSCASTTSSQRAAACRWSRQPAIVCMCSSPQSPSGMSARLSDSPSGVSEYSTRGGISG